MDLHYFYPTLASASHTAAHFKQLHLFRALNPNKYESNCLTALLQPYYVTKDKEEMEIGQGMIIGFLNKSISVEISVKCQKDGKDLHHRLR